MKTWQQRVQQRHHRYAARYRSAAVINHVLADGLLQRLAYLRLKPQTIIDLGSGSGYLSQALCQRFPDAQIVAVDLTHAMHRQIQQPKLKRTNWHLVTADAYQLPMATHSVDVIVSNVLLPLLLDYPALWQECQRVLQPGGLLLFSNLGPDTLQELKHSCLAIDQHSHVNTFIDLHDMGDGLIAAGFQDPVLDADRVQLSYPSLSALLHELKNLGSLQALAEPDTRYYGKAFWQHIERYYRQHFSDANQRLLVSVDAYFGHAFNPLKPRQRPEADGGIGLPISTIKRHHPA